jgi:hypothetical protein
LAVSALLTENRTRLLDVVERYLLEAAREHPERVMGEVGAGLSTPVTGWRLGLHELRPVLEVLPFSIVRAWVDEHGLLGARALSRLLPVSEVKDGVASVPEVTAYVMERWGDDKRVRGEFLAGAATHGWRSGDIARQYDRDAEDARRFLTHPCRWVQEWAVHAARDARAHADWFRADDEDLEAP